MVRFLPFIFFVKICILPVLDVTAYSLLVTLYVCICVDAPHMQVHTGVCVHVFICVDVPHMQLHTDVCVHVFTCVYALHVQVYSSSTHQVDNRLTITCGICSLTHDPSSFTRITKCIISFKLCRSLG